MKNNDKLKFMSKFELNDGKSEECRAMSSCNDDQGYEFKLRKIKEEVSREEMDSSLFLHQKIRNFYDESTQPSSNMNKQDNCRISPFKGNILQGIEERKFSLRKFQNSFQKNDEKKIILSEKKGKEFRNIFFQEKTKKKKKSSNKNKRRKKHKRNSTVFRSLEKLKMKIENQKGEIRPFSNRRISKFKKKKRRKKNKKLKLRTTKSITYKFNNKNKRSRSGCSTRGSKMRVKLSYDKQKNNSFRKTKENLKRFINSKKMGNSQAGNSPFGSFVINASRSINMKKIRLEKKIKNWISQKGKMKAVKIKKKIKKLNKNNKNGSWTERAQIRRKGSPRQNRDFKHLGNDDQE